MFKNSLLVSLYCVQEVGGEFFVEEVGGVSVFRRLRSGCEVDAVLQSAPTPPRTRPLGTVTSLSSAPRPKQHFRWRQCRRSSSKSKLTRREGGNQC